MSKSSVQPFQPPDAGDLGLGTKDDVAKLCRVSSRTVEAWVRAKKIPFIRMGHRLLRFDLAAVAAAVRRWSTKEIK